MKSPIDWLICVAPAVEFDEIFRQQVPISNLKVILFGLIFVLTCKVS